MTDRSVKPWHGGLFVLHLVLMSLLSVVLVYVAAVGVFGALMSIPIFLTEGVRSVVWTQMMAFGLAGLPFVAFGSALVCWVPGLTSVWGLVRGRPWWIAASALGTVLCVVPPLLDLGLVLTGWWGIQTLCADSFSC